MLLITSAFRENRCRKLGLFLWAYMKLRIRLHHDTVRYFERAERLSRVYVPLRSTSFEILYCCG